MPAILIHRVGYNAAVFDRRFFEEAWPTISRRLESGLDGRPFVLESPRIVLVATK
jgi:hypothetical protein